MLSELSTPRRASCTPLPVARTPLPFPNPSLVLLRPMDADPVLAAVSYSSRGVGQLLLISLSSNQVDTHPLGENSASLAAGADDALYLGLPSGRILCKPSESSSLEELLPADAERPISAVLCTSRGLVYFGAESGALFLYDAAAGALRTVSGPAGASARVSALVELPDGRVAAFLSGAQPRVLAVAADGTGVEAVELAGLTGEEEVRQAVALDDERLLLSTAAGRRLFSLCARTLRVLEPVSPLPEGDDVFSLLRSADDLLACAVSGRVYRRVPEGWLCLGAPMPEDPLTCVARADGRLAGVTYHGRLVQSTPDQRMYTVRALPTAVEQGLQISAMGMAPDRKLYVAFAGNMRLGCWDPDEDDAVGDAFVAAPYPGSVTALGFAGERLLIGFGDTCGIMAYYPELPYRLLENPRLLGRVGDALRRPLGPMVHHGTDVYCAAAAMSRRGDGAILRVRPMDNEVALFDRVIPGQSLTSLVADRLSGLLLAGGAVRDGEEDAGPAALALWSSQDERTLQLVTPFPDATRVRVWAAEGGRVYVTDGGERLAVLSSDGAVLESAPFPLGVITALATNRDGRLYGLAGGWLFHLDAEAQTYQRLVEAQGSCLTEVRRGLFAFTHDGRVYTARLW